MVGEKYGSSKKYGNHTFFYQAQFFDYYGKKYGNEKVW